MIKHAGAAIAASLYIALSAWIVNAVGRAHRETIKEPVSRQAQRTESSRDVVAKAATASRQSPPNRPPWPLSPPSIAATPSQIPASTGQSSAPAKSSAPARPELPPTVAMATKPDHIPGPVVSPSSPAMRREENDIVKPGPVNAQRTEGGFPDLGPIDDFFATSRATKRWDLSLNPSREAQLGVDLNEMVLLPRFYQRLEDGKLQRRVYDAAKPLEKAVSRKEVEYHYIVLDSKAINAFSHPGGYVYVTKGLLDWIGEDEDYLLQFVLAHEIHHVDKGHALHCLQDPGFGKMPYGTVSLFYLFIFPYGYRPESMDYEADAWAIRQLVILQHTRRECLKFLRRLDGYEEDQGSIEGHLPPRRGDVVSLLENHYRAHPSARKRLEKAELLLPVPAAKAR